MRTFTISLYSGRNINVRGKVETLTDNDCKTLEEIGLPIETREDWVAVVDFTTRVFIRKNWIETITVDAREDQK